MDGHNKILFRAALWVAALSAVAACSVKEDRTECPVYVTVLTDRFVQLGLNEGMLSFAGARHIGREEVSFLSLLRRGYVQPCPRDYARVSVVSGLENYMIADEVVHTVPGMQAGLVWAYGESFSAYSDEYQVDAVPHKQYCLVKFLFDDSPVAPDGYDWRFRIRADCSGMNLYTLEPLEGDYEAVVGPNAVGEWYGVIPRQKANNMQMDIFLPDSDSARTGRTDYVVDLGGKFAELGYDWTAEDLRDVEVKVGFSSATVTVSVLDWEGDDAYKNIEI